MTNRNWFKKRLSDPFLLQARREGFRSRAAFKLLEILKKYSLVAFGDAVLDIGSAPGSWMQVLRKTVGKKGRVVGIDLLNISPLPGCVFFQGDIRSEEGQRNVIASCPQGFKAIFSDVAPNTTGVHHADCANSVELVQLILDLGKQCLQPGGAFVAKVFEGEEYKELHSRAKEGFDFAKSYKPKASLVESREVYLIGKGFRK